MSIRFTCRRCKEEVTATDNAAGEEMDCPACGAAVTVPSGGTRREGDRARPAPARSRDDDEDDRPSRRSSNREDAVEKPSTGVQLGMGIPALVLGILSGLFALIPCLGMFTLPVSALALLLGLIGLVVAAMRKWNGMGFPIAGTIVSLLAIGIGIGQIVVTRNFAKNVDEGLTTLAAQQAAAEQQRLAREAELEKEKYKPGKPLAQAWQNDTAFLTELEEAGVKVGPERRLGKRGMLGIPKGRFGEQDRELRVGGVGDKNALTLNPPPNDFGSVKYRLEGQAQRVKGEVGLADNALRPTAGVTFEILGDNKSLWKSKALQRQGEKEAFDVSVKGIKEIELRSQYPAFNQQVVHPVWLNVQVTRGKLNGEEEQEKKDEEKKDKGKKKAEEKPKGDLLPPPNEEKGDE